MTKTSVLLSSLGIALLSSSAFAQELAKMESDTAGLFGRFLAEKFAKSKDLQLKIPVDAEQALGLSAKNEGIILVPLKTLKDGPEKFAENGDVETKKGAGLAYLFMSARFNPLIDDKPIDKKKLRTVVLEQGDQKVTATALLLAARHIEGEEWRLYVYGSGKEPLIDIKFFEAEDKKEGPLNLHVQDVKDGKGSLVITVFKAYEATLQIGHKFD